MRALLDGEQIRDEYDPVDIYEKVMFDEKQRYIEHDISSRDRELSNFIYVRSVLSQQLFKLSLSCSFMTRCRLYKCIKHVV